MRTKKLKGEKHKTPPQIQNMVLKEKLNSPTFLNVNSSLLKESKREQKLKSEEEKGAQCLHNLKEKTKEDLYFSQQKEEEKKNG